MGTRADELHAEPIGQPTRRGADAPDDREGEP
jgi:hypothetical protein